MKSKGLILLLFSIVLPNINLLGQELLIPGGLMTVSTKEYLEHFINVDTDKYTSAVLVTPCFSPVHTCLFYNKSGYELVVATYDYDSQKKTEYRCQITGKFPKVLHELISSSVLSSSYCALSSTTDSTVYEFISYYASAFLYDCENNRQGICSELQTIIDLLIQYTIDNDALKIKELMPLMESLTNKFKRFYPIYGKGIDHLSMYY